MINVNTLRATVSRLKMDRESKLKLAESLRNSAESHASTGDQVKADLDAKSAERYQTEADDIEQRTSSILAEIAYKERQAEEIERKIDDLKKQFDSDLAKLESERNNILN